MSRTYREDYCHLKHVTTVSWELISSNLTEDEAKRLKSLFFFPFAPAPHLTPCLSLDFVLPCLKASDFASYQWKWPHLMIKCHSAHVLQNQAVAISMLWCFAISAQCPWQRGWYGFLLLNLGVEGKCPLRRAQEAAERPVCFSACSILHKAMVILHRCHIYFLCLLLLSLYCHGSCQCIRKWLHANFLLYL